MVDGCWRPTEQRGNNQIQVFGNNSICYHQQPEFDITTRYNLVTQIRAAFVWKKFGEFV